MILESPRHGVEGEVAIKRLVRTSDKNMPCPGSHEQFELAEHKVQASVCPVLAP